MSKPAQPVMLAEATAEGRLTETDKPGRFLVRIIDEGEGSSGYYPADTLQLAEADRVFPAGLHMYLDHAAALRRGPHGERSVKDLAAVQAEDARYDPNLKGLVAEVDVFGAEGMPVDRLKEIAPHIGVSISASAIMGPPLQGQRKATVRRLVEAESVDFVVRAGRGGAVLAILESQAVEATSQDRRDQLDRAVRELYHDPANSYFAGLRDYDPDRLLAFFYRDDAVWQQPYTVAADDLSVTLTGAPEEVRVVTTYVPVQSGGVTAPTQEAPMSDELKDTVAALERKLSEALKQAQEAEAKAAAVEQREKVTEAKRQMADKVKAAMVGKPDAMVARVTLALDPQIVEAELPANIDALIAGAIESEQAYLKGLNVAESKLVGFGASTTVTESAPKRTHNAFGQPIAKEA